MFFNGDLQSGIALALSESKSVACFVKGDDGQSSLWEDDFLKDEQIATALARKAVTIRINGGSQEAQYLAAYYPAPVLPAFIIIHNGRLVIDLRAGEKKDQFKAAVLRALSSRSSEVQAQPETSNSGHQIGSSTSLCPPPQSPTLDTDTNASPSSTVNLANMNQRDNRDVDPTVAVASNVVQSIATTSASPGIQPSQTVQNLLADRRRRLEIDKKEKDAAERAERKAKADARKEAMVAAPDSAKAKQASYASQQRKRQQEVKLERERILRQIEHDKAERKEKEDRRKAVAKAEAEGTDGAGGLVDQQLATEVSPPKVMRSSDCAVQVRLFDGSTIRTRFPSDQTLRGNVRPWIDQRKSDDVPYTFKQIFTPMSNRTFSITEEEQTLQSVGLSPSATLIIVPIKGYTAAYNGGQGIVSKGASAGYNIVSAGAGIVTGTIGTLLGLGRANAPEELPGGHESTMLGNADANTTGTGSGINVRTLQDQRDNQDSHQLYNGNQLNFEPRQDSRDKDE